MATWTRNGTGTAPSASGVNVTGTYELDNATAPGDFDPDAVNSVRIQWTASATFPGDGDDTWTITAIALTLNGNGTHLADVTPSSTALNSGNTSQANDETDSSISTGFTAAQWEGAELNGAGAASPDEWVVFNQVMKGDGGTCTISAVTVTIDYTPAATPASPVFFRPSIRHLLGR